MLDVKKSLNVARASRFWITDGKSAVFVVAGFLVIAISFYLPILALFQVDTSSGNGVVEAMGNYLLDPLFWHALAVSIRIALWTTSVCLLFAVPVAIYVAHARSYLEGTLVAIIVAALLSSILLRTFTWYVLLSREGPVVMVMQALGVEKKVLDGGILFSEFAVILGMVHILLPTAILILWSHMRVRAKKQAMQARLLGASFGYYLVHVCLPVNLGAIGSTALLILVLSLGFYVTPMLLGGGGGNTLMIGVLIDEQVNRFGNWDRGAGLALLLVLTLMFVSVGVLLLLSLVARIFRRV